jgi:hypothetical protein
VAAFSIEQTLRAAVGDVNGPQLELAINGSDSYLAHRVYIGSPVYPDIADTVE